MFDFLEDIPVVGDIYNGLRGNPDAIKAAYDQAMQRSQQSGDQIRNFLLGQQAKAQQYYAPMQRMFQNMYGTGGIQAPMVPGAQGPRAPAPGQNPQMQAMFGMAPMPGAGGGQGRR